jgi:hypothetical protein
MLTEHFQPTTEGEARLLLLIAAFSKNRGALEGRTKLAKLDFFLRYPRYFRRALEIRRPYGELRAPEATHDMETRMVRYRYGPWDPSYYAILGRLIGKGLINPVPFARGVGYKATAQGAEVAERLGRETAWHDYAERTKLLKQYFDLAGTTLKDFIYSHFPEVTQADWGERL